MKPVLSLHPFVPGHERYKLAPGALPDGPLIEKLSRAKAVIVPQSVSSSIYAACKRHCARVFPEYSFRFGMDDKPGQARLFSGLSLPHPQTEIFPGTGSIADADEFAQGLKLPCVLKAGAGGGGNGVFAARNKDELKSSLAALEQRFGTKTPFVAQAWVNTRGRDLRVVVIGSKMLSYWRVQNRPNEFRNNVCRGARIEYNMEPKLTEKGLELARLLCAKTEINLAAIDILFEKETPLLGEINFVFGRKGVGGTPRFRALLNTAVSKWIALAS
jgi:ribosomal protein S6--L-glutamate ligase